MKTLLMYHAKTATNLQRDTADTKPVALIVAALRTDTTTTEVQVIRVVTIAGIRARRPVGAAGRTVLTPTVVVAGRIEVQRIIIDSITSRLSVFSGD